MIVKNTILLVILVSLAISCSYPSEDAITIGAVLSLTGDGAFWGTHSQNGMLLALEDINSNGGINGKELKIITEDSRCIPKEGASAINKLIDVDEISVVIGDVCSSVSLAMAPIAQEKNVVMLTPCSESPDITKVGNYIFRTWTPTGRQANAMVDYAFDILGFTKIAILNINNDFGVSLTNEFKKSFEAKGGKVVAIENYEQSERDFRTHLTKIKAINPDAIYMTSYPQDGVVAVKQMKELGMDMQILGTSGIDSASDVFDVLGDLSEGILVSNLEDSSTIAYKERYVNVYGGEWPGMISCASVAYDDVMIMAEAIRKVGTDPDSIRDFLANLKNYPGVSGEITFDEEGNLDRQHKIFAVENQRSVQIT